MAKKKTKDKEKIIFEEELICPHCKKYIINKRIKKTISSPVKGEYEEFTTLEKSEQTRL